MKIVLDKYNSKIFGMKMGNILEFDFEKDVKHLNSHIKKTDFNHLSIKIDTNSKETFNFFIKNNFYLVDTQVTYKLLIKNNQFERSPNVRGALIEDTKKILEIAEQSFIIDRFHSDPNLSFNLSNKYYQQWSENLLNDEDTISYIYQIEDDVVGFSFWKLEGDISRLILVAVSNDYRGRGIYSKMISHFLNEYNDKIDIVLMGTQINNYPVHKYWSKIGATIIESNYVLHKVI